MTLTANERGASPAPFFMKFTEEQIEIIYFGIDAFNTGRYNKAHEWWEKLWKELRNDNVRNCLKPFIQLSGAYLNCIQMKDDAAAYLLKRANLNIIKYKASLDLIILSDALMTDIDVLLRKKITVKVFNQLQIKKAG